jgi:hypothetical protein
MLMKRHAPSCALASLALLVAACGDSGSSGTATDSGSASSTGPGPVASSSGGETPTTSVGGTDTATGSGSDSASSTGPAPDPTTGTTSDDTSTGAVVSSSETGGVKFDVGTGDTTTGGVMPGLGSCRPSEIYGASGGFPAFTDPAYANFLEKKILVMTTNAQEDNFVLHILDISGKPPPPNLNYLAPRYHDPAWTKPNLGQLFGLTLDSAGNIYVAATTVYGANPAPNTIKKIDGKTGKISVFATLPNSGPAFGNINYDCVSETLYASNHEDGRIYQLDMAGNVVSTYHHHTGTITMGPANDPGEPNGQFAPLGQRPWAVQSHAGRLYYSVWWEDSGRNDPQHGNEIWSVEYSDMMGVPNPATKQLEFTVPSLQGNTYSNPVSDISFAATGWMLISERTMLEDTQTLAHQSTTYEYDYDGMNKKWTLKGTTFVVGELPNSAAGGVDHDFDEGGYVWMSGDALDFYTPAVVYGVQGTPHAGGDITNSTLIDLDGEVVNQDKTALGDVEIPIPGDADPVPPPT